MGTSTGWIRTPLRLLLACLLTVAFVVAVGPPVRADDEKPPPGVQVTLYSVSPAWRTGDRLTITGRVTNTSTVPMRQVQVSLWRSFDPIIDTPLAEVADYPDNLPLGARTTNQTGNLFNLTSPESPVFASGASATFTVTATLDELGLPASAGAYLVGVHVRGIPEGQQNQLLGRGRVLWPGSQPPGAAVSPVVVLSSKPAMVAPQVFDDDHLAGELLGRLNQLMALAEQPSSVVLIDPALFDELTAMSAGYTLTSGAEPNPDGQLLATQWLARLQPLLTRPGVYRLPYGDPELKAISASAVGAVVDSAVAALPEDHPLSRLGVALAPRSGVVDHDLLAQTATLRPVLAVSSATGTPSAGSIEGVTMLNADPQLRAPGPGPAPSTTVPQIAGRMLSQLAREPQSSAVVVVREIGDIQLMRALQGAVVVRNALEIPSTPVTLVKSVRVADPDPSLRSTIEAGKKRMIAWSALVGDAEAGTKNAQQVASKASSSSLNTDGYRARAYLAQAVQLTGPDVAQARISLTSAQSFVMSTDVGSFPVTITNREDTLVVVKVRFTSENPQRLTIPDTEQVTIEPGATGSVNFTPQAHNNGVVTVTAQVISISGEPIGPSRRLTVTATSLGDVGWIIIIASGIVLLGTTALRIKQVQRERARAVTSAVAAAEVDLVAKADRHGRDPSNRPHP